MAETSALSSGAWALKRDDGTRNLNYDSHSARAGKHSALGMGHYVIGGGGRKVPMGGWHCSRRSIEVPFSVDFPRGVVFAGHLAVAAPVLGHAVGREFLSVIGWRRGEKRWRFLCFASTRPRKKSCAPFILPVMGGWWVARPIAQPPWARDVCGEIRGREVTCVLQLWTAA